MSADEPPPLMPPTAIVVRDLFGRNKPPWIMIARAICWMPVDD
jgi:hypothetical protein